MGWYGSAGIAQANMAVHESSRRWYDGLKGQTRKASGMSKLLDDLLAWCRSEREALQDQLRLLESGVMKTGEHRLGSLPRDTTAESIARARRQIEELDKILARHPDV